MEDEYLLTNQLGGYCASTFHNGNTRKYHGLLVTADDNLNRQLVVSQLEEKIIIEGKEYYISTTAYAQGDVVTPGMKLLSRYSIHPQTACFEYNTGTGVRVNKEVNLAQESNTIIIRYKVTTDKKISFNISPLLTKRSIYDLKKYKDTREFAVSSYLNTATIRMGSNDKLTVKILSFNPKSFLNVANKIDTSSHIYNNLYYAEEAKRAYDAVEDLVQPFKIVFSLEPGESFISIQFSYQNGRTELPLKKINNGLKLYYSLDLRQKENTSTPLIAFKTFLLENYHSFLIDSHFRKSVVAGFPWFGDWGRDTFISFPGLLLATGEFTLAKMMIDYWSRFISDGLIPNSLPDKAYNSIDASLWFIVAIYRYYLATDDLEALRSWYPKIRNILVELINGSGYSITVDNNGFLIWTDPQYNLTWMDALVDGVSTTGRIGACVEIEMLWYNCLKIYEYFQKELGVRDDNQEITGLIKLVYQKFNKLFWNQDAEYAYDFVYNGVTDTSIRPNVIIGLSLPFKLFDKHKVEKIIYKAGRELYTQAGMLTLNKTDLKYNGFYEGTQKERDLSYHNGTIWPFLLGFYLKAILMNYQNDPVKVEGVKEMLIDFWEQMRASGLHYIPEVYAANDYHPDGCLAQAWNYGLFLEVYQLLS